MWFSPGIPVYSTNKTDRHDITEKLVEVVLNNNDNLFKTMNDSIAIYFRSTVKNSNVEMIILSNYL
jgi:cobalamin-dependent methionine synthase I